MDFCHLHTHSDFSLLTGLCKIDDLLDACQRYGMKSLAITDQNAVYGAVDFFVKAKSRGIKPIIGVEIFVAPNGKDNKTSTASAKKTNQLVLLVENEKGYKNLLKIVTIAQLDGFYYVPRVDYDVLKKHSSGLIAISGNATGEIAEIIKNDNLIQAEKKAILYRDIFGENNFFLELNHQPNLKEQEKINSGLKKISKKTNIPLVACGDVYYINKEDSDTHDVLTCIRLNRKVDEGDRPNFKHLDLSFHSQQEMKEFFKDVPEAIENTVKISDRCNFEIELGNTKLPYYPLPEGETADEHLLNMCKDGFKLRYGDKKISKEQKERLYYELDIIKKTGYASYFLIVQDFVNWARKQGIVVGPGRGSAAGSFVSYLVGITNIDPIEYKLLFERFLNPERVSMPDVDLDFADDRREDVLEYCRQTYGSDHVANIITFGTMAARAAIRDSGRALGFPYNFCDQISKLIPMFYSIEKTLKEVPDFKRLFEENPDARELISVAKKLEGLNRHSSIHACGVVITDKPIVEYSALQRVNADEEALTTQYASSTKFSAVEKIGLLKMDFLGLKNLTIIQNSIKMIKKIHGVEIDIENIPLDNKETFKLLQDGLTIGIFQLESSGMRRYLKLLKPTELEDIIAMVALYRPGPMEWIPDFISGKHGDTKVKYLDPKLESILSDTYGVTVYQEQVMRIAQDLAGFTLGEADILRKAMGKKIVDLIQEQKIKFIEGCVAQGIDRQVATDIFVFIEPFAGYGFNRSHAACYGLIGYQTAYLKAHYPAEYMAALMTSDQGNTDRIAIEATECRDLGIEVLPPDINESFEEFSVLYDEKDKEKKNPRIRFGLNAIKNVGHAIAKEIVKERKLRGNFKSITDLCERITSKDLNKRALDALAKVGALESFGHREQIISSMDNILSFIKNSKVERTNKQNSLFGNEMLTRATITLKNVTKASKKQELTWEKELIGLYVSDHPAREYKSFFANSCTELRDLSEELAEKQIIIGGIVIAISTILLKSGKNMSFITLEDGTGSIECLVFPKLLEETTDLWIAGKALRLSGHLSAKNDELKFLVDKAEEISSDMKHEAERIALTKSKYKQPISPENSSTKEIKKKSAINKKVTKISKNVPTKKFIIKLPNSETIKTIENIKKILDTCEPGFTVIYLHHNNNKMKTGYSVKMTKQIELDLNKLLNNKKE